MPAVKKLERDPFLFSSNYVQEGEQDSRNLVDDAWILSPTPHHGTVIWLHGIGEGREEAKKIFSLMSPPGFRVVVPRAPLTPVTALDEQEHRTWYDLEKANLHEEDEEDYRGISRSKSKVHALIASEAKLIDSKKIVLAGFAQGGALAIHAGLQCPLPLAGILSHSGYVALPDEYPRVISEANRNIRICAVHGRLDEVVPLEFAKARYRVLEKAGLDVELRVEFSLAHQSSEQSLFEMQRWFEDTVAGRLTKSPKRL
jgi:phospholipase/carboxylesterase